MPHWYACLVRTQPNNVTKHSHCVAMSATFPKVASVLTSNIRPFEHTQYTYTLTRLTFEHAYDPQQAFEPSPHHAPSPNTHSNSNAYSMFECTHHSADDSKTYSTFFSYPGKYGGLLGVFFQGVWGVYRRVSRSRCAFRMKWRPSA